MVKGMRQLSPVLLFNIKSFLAVSPLHLKISMHILLTVLYTFPMVLTKRICLKNQELLKLVIISFILMALTL